MDDLPVFPGYVVRERIGEGGSSIVYKATEEKSGASVAVKVLHPHLATDAVSIERLRRELRLTRTLQHPQIVAGFDLVHTVYGLALVMELVEGQTLKELIRSRAPLDVPTALGIGEQLLDVLEICHDNNVVHRDLKPQNVVVEDAGTIKLLDFGIARVTGLRDLTRSGATLGSPEYMAPELFDASDFDPRSDLYAVGVVLYEMLTGRLPYYADSALLFVDTHRRPAAPLDIDAGDDGNWLEQFVAKLIATDLNERYQTAEEALGDLRAKRVVSNELPELDMRRCVSCDEPTLAALLICTRCGYHGLETSLPGQYDVLLSEDYDPARLQSFLRNFRVGHSDLDAEDSAATRDLAKRIDKTSAELLKQRAQEHGLYSHVKKRSPLSAWSPVVSLYALAASVTLIVVAPLAPWFVNMDLLRAFYPDSPSYAMDLMHLGLDILILVGALVFLALAALRFYRRERTPPLLRTSAEIDAQLERDYAWMNALVPHLAKMQPGRMRDLSAKLVERYVLLRRDAPRWDEALGERMQSVLLDAVRSASLLSEFESAATHPKIHEWERRLSGGEADPEIAESPEVIRNLEAVLELQDAAGRLNGRLAELLSVFNAVASKAVVLGATGTRVEVDALASTTAALEIELTAASEAYAELDAIL